MHHGRGWQGQIAEPAIEHSRVPAPGSPVALDAVFRWGRRRAFRATGRASASRKRAHLSLITSLINLRVAASPSAATNVNNSVESTRGLACDKGDPRAATRRNTKPNTGNVKGTVRAHATAFFAVLSLAAAAEFRELREGTRYVSSLACCCKIRKVRGPVLCPDHRLICT